MIFRVAVRLGWFLGEVTLAISNYFFTTALVSAKNKRAARASWLHRSARRHLKIFGCATTVAGPLPPRGLLVSNHLSYLDVLVFSAIVPAIFVSKTEVRRWPLFGWLAALSGTIFVERARRTQVGEVNREIAAALNEEVLVVIFPEGTSSNGETILPFRSPLLEPALRGGHEISTAWIHYTLPDGDARAEVCYTGEQIFFPHVLNLLGKKSVHATVRFGKFERRTDDRKELANQLREAVVQLKMEN